MNFSTQYSSDQARILAFTVVSIIPAIIFYASRSGSSSAA